MLNIVEIQAILPHRYPFLFVDRVLELEPGKRAVGVKLVSGNEEFFQGHFPGLPIMPAVLIIEAMAQVGGILLLSVPSSTNKIPLFASIDKAKFRHPVFPGDELVMTAETVRTFPSRGMGVVQAKAYVGTRLVAEAEMKFALKATEGPLAPAGSPAAES